MSNIICVSHPKQIPILKFLAIGNTDKSLDKVLSWHSDELETPLLISCLLDFGSVSYFNSIRMDIHSDYTNFFPSRIRFETSLNGDIWEPILHKVGHKTGLHNKLLLNFSLTSSRYLKLVFLADKKNNAKKYFAAFGELQVMISGIINVEASSELDRLWIKENIFDNRSEYGWSTLLRSKKEKEYIQLDLGSVNRLCEVHLLSKADQNTFFPTAFQLYYSEDNISWHIILEENAYLAEPSCWYRWRFLTCNARFIRLVILEGSQTYEGKYISQIVEIKLFAIEELVGHYGNSSVSLPIANTIRSGLVRLAADGETKEGVAVQSNDSRLVDASTEQKGIVELASDGETKEGVAVQSSDRRLEYASEELAGIVRLAREGEIREKHAVQSNDSRLQDATENSEGIVKLASNGESASGLVVQGNDRRLRAATTETLGIVKIAKNFSDNPSEVVQANDSRLLKASTEAYGIMRFSLHGEKAKNKAVQSDDSRLASASTIKEGIVILAKDLERHANKVVQSNDSRLQDATENSKGIVQLSPLGTSLQGKVVQSNDSRLNDARVPLPHKHDYASKSHSFDSHEGTLKIEGSQGNIIKGINKPPNKHAPITGVNKGDGAGILGVGESEGVVGSGMQSGLTGLGINNGYGVLGVSRNNAAGVFLSEHTYSLIAGGTLKDRDIQSSPLSFLSKGISRFDDSIYSYSNSSCIAAYFAIRDNEHITDGDVLTIDENNEKVYRTRGYGNLQVIGVAVSQAALVFNPPQEILPSPGNIKKDPFVLIPQAGKVLVAISGIVKLKVNAEQNPIRAGDLLVSSLETGLAECLDFKRHKPGMAFARSLNSIKEGQATIKAILVMA